MRLHNYMAALIVSLFFVSCAQLQFPEFTVESCDFNEDSVCLSFSAEPNQYTIIKSFSLKEDSKDTTGTFNFEGTKVTYFPDNGIQSDYIYDLTITTDAEDLHGNSLQLRYETTYTTRPNYERPYVVSVTPKNEEDLQTQVNEIVFEFSKPVDVNSFKTAFSISPSVNYIVTTQKEDAVVIVTPTELFKKNSRYEIKLSTKLSDKNHNYLLNPFSSTFTNFTDEKMPEHTLFYNDGTQNVLLTTQNLNSNLNNNVELTLEFDEQVDINYIVSYIEIQPNLSITVTPDKISKKSAKITFSDDIVWGQEYSLIILKGIKDLCGNETKQDYNYKLNFNNEKNRPVTLAKACINLRDGKTSYDELKNYESLTFDVSNFNTTGTPVQTEIYAIFNISSDATTISDLSVMDAFSTTYTNACFNSITAKTVSILTENQVSLNTQLKNVYDSITLDGGKLCVVKVGIEINNSGNATKGVLTISFDKGIKDDLGNVMQTECEYHINKQ